MKKLIRAVTLAMVIAAAPLFAQMVETTVTATNGVAVSRNADEFAGRYEYSAPPIRFTPTDGRGSGMAFVAKMRRNGALGDLNVQGFIIYSGEWQFFSSAVFRGGEAVDYTRTSGNVGSCRYGCTLTENFMIRLTPTQIKKYTENGSIAMQLRATKNGNTAMVSVPVAYIDAVNEVAK